MPIMFRSNASGEKQQATDHSLHLTAKQRHTYTEQIPQIQHGHKWPTADSLFFIFNYIPGAGIKKVHTLFWCARARTCFQPSVVVCHFISPRRTAQNSRERELENNKKKQRTFYGALRKKHTVTESCTRHARV